jgi:hypothetical protein
MATGAESLALQESVSQTALMSVGPEDQAIGFNILDVMHVRLGHMSERNIKTAVKNHLFNGCNITYNDIKDFKLRMCYTCQMGRMHAFRRPGVTNHKYEPLDFISLMITLRGACGLIRVETRERTPC